MKLIILGATGDLAKRKIYPALEELFLKGLLPKHLQVVGASRRDWSDDQYREFVSDQLAEFTESNSETTGDLQGVSRDEFYECFRFVEIQFGELKTYSNLQKVLNQGEVIYLYLAIEPGFFEQVITDLRESGITNDHGDQINLLIEKPFGKDLTSAKSLQETLTAEFSEEQIYRVDHVLNRDGLQDIVSFRNHNEIFGPLFKKELIDHIQVTYSETLGIEGRGHFYENTGAIRDMVQSHILEILALVLLEPFKNYSAAELKQARAEIIASLELASANQLTVGQYRGYTEEDNVADNSKVETFVALELKSNHDSWLGVPIFLRTGKKLADRYLDIQIVFKTSSNILTFRINPFSGINLQIVKSPGGKSEIDEPKNRENRATPEKQLEKINLTYCYRPNEISDPYANVLNCILSGDSANFVSFVEVEASWKLVDHIRDIATNSELEIYDQGSMGPISSFEIPKKHGRRWLDNEISDFCRI